MIDVMRHILEINRATYPASYAMFALETSKVFVRICVVLAEFLDNVLTHIATADSITVQSN